VELSLPGAKKSWNIRSREQVYIQFIAYCKLGDAFSASSHEEGGKRKWALLKN